MKKQFWIYILISLAWGLQAQINEAWRPTQLIRSNMFSSDYASSAHSFTYGYYYVPNHNYLLDSLSIFEYQSVSDGSGGFMYMEYFLPPVTGGFDWSEDTDSYLIRTVWPTYENDVFRREYRRTYGGKWMSDKLLSLTGTLVSEKTFTYNEFGELATVFCTRAFPQDTHPGIWRFDLSYDPQGRKVQELRYKYTDNEQWELQYRLDYFYRTDHYVVDCYAIDRSLPYHVSKDFFPMEVFSHWQLDEIKIYQMESSEPVLMQIRNYNDLYSIQPNNDLYVAYNTWVKDLRTYSYMFNPFGMPLRYSQNISFEDGSSSVSLTYNWQSLGIVENSEQYLLQPRPSVQVWPNPFYENLNIELSKAVNASKIKIYNFRGQLVRSLDQSDCKAKWDGRDNNGIQVSKGIYLLQVSGSGHKQNMKIVKL